MKKLIHNFVRVCIVPILLLPFITTQARQLPPPSDFTISVLNFTQPTDRTIEFDVYLLDTDNTQSFELGSIQLGFLLNSNVFTGGTLTATIDNSQSGLLITQQFSASPSIVTPVANYPNQTLLRLAGRTPPGTGNGTIISSTGNGTLITHFTLTSTVAWSSSLTADLIFNSSTAVLPLYATRVSQYISNVNTALAVVPGTNALICCNPTLNAFPPGVFNVTGGGSYCEGSQGLPVGLSGSETSATYQLFLDGIPSGLPVAGTGSSLLFGNQTTGTYTVTATNGSGSTPMNGSAIITVSLMPAVPGEFTTSTAIVYQGATGILYTVPNDPTVTYSWTYSGTGATINGSSNSVSLNYSATSTSGNLSVTATNGCGISTPRSMAITVNPLLPSDYSLSVLNMIQTTDRTIEFDVYLLDTDPAQSLQMASVQLGFMFNSNIYSGGVLSAAINNTGSGLIPAQQFSALPSLVAAPSGYPDQTLLRLAGRTPPGAGGGTIISTTGNGTLLTHFILTSTLPWTFNSMIDLTFTSSSALNPIYATRISAYIGNTNTALIVTPGSNALICCNPVLNTIPLAFNVIGGGAYCQGEAGLPVTLSGSEIGVTYTLHGGQLPEPIIAGTGTEISFGNQPYGVYTVSASNLAGTFTMNGNAIITENPSLPASLNIAVDANYVDAGTLVSFTATPVNGGTNPSITWYRNSVIDATGLTYSLIPVDGDEIFAIMVADPALACVSGSPATSDTITMSVNTIKVVNLTAMFEGLYNGTNMNQAFNETGPQWPLGIADHVIVELHNNSTYSIVEYSVADIALSTNGALSVEIPASYNGSYYVTIKHRNSIETTTATPVAFSGDVINIDFISPTAVFGGNLKNINGTYVIYSGDVNQDLIIDSSDMSIVSNQSLQATSGYLPEDINGDGLIDSIDLARVYNNAIQAAGAIIP